MYKKIISVLLIISLCAYTVVEVKASTISDLKKQQKETQEKLDAVQGTLSDLQDEQDALEDEIAGIDESIVEILAAIDIMQEEIEIKKEELVQVESALDEAQKAEVAQNEAMKKRIQFMYEKGEQTYMELLFEAENMADFLNK